jgi:hypothetical protein
MYGYPEAFIPQSEIGAAGGTVPLAGTPAAAPVTASVRTGEATA